MKCGVLSYKDIKRMLGKKIFIHPYKPENLKECSYNLTLSRYAYSIDDKKILINAKNEIVIPKHETAMLITNESIYVTGEICGTYHSKVSLVSKGLSHISTILDPYYIGKSAITVHNYSNKDIILEVGATFVTLVFYRVTTRVDYQDKQIEDNHQSREDLVDYKITEFKDPELDMNFKKEYLKDIGRWSQDKCMTNDSSIKEECRKDLEVIKSKEKEEKNQKHDWGKICVYVTVIGIIIATIIGILSLLK